MIRATAAECDAVPQLPEAVDLGPAQLDPTKGSPTTSAFVAETGDIRLGQAMLTRLQITAGEGSPAYPIVNVGAWEGDRIDVEADLDPLDRVAAGLQPSGAGLRLTAMANHTFLPRTLGERLSEVTELNAASGLLTASDGPIANGRAILPPEIGIICGSEERRRSTLAAAAVQLMHASRTVLVLSTDNTALDDLLIETDRVAGHPPVGTIVRVGISARRAVSLEPRLTIDGALAHRSHDLGAAMADVAAELRNLTAAARPSQAEVDSDLLARTATVPAEFAPSDPQNVAIEPDPEALARRLDETRTALQLADQAVQVATQAAKAASTDHAAARQANRLLDRARVLHVRIVERAKDVEEAMAASAASASGVGRLASDEARAHQLIVAAEVAASRLQRRDEALAELEAAQQAARELGHSRAQVANAAATLAAARSVHAAAERDSLHAHAQRARIGGEVQRLQALILSIATDAARSRPHVTGAAERRAAETRISVSGLAVQRCEAAPTEPLRDELRARYQELRNARAARGADVVAQTPVVFASMAQLVANRALYERTFDNVLIEQAGSTPAAYCLYAATRATRALTLATGLDETLPPAALSDTDQPERVRRWVSASILDVLGMTSPEAIARHPSGMVTG